jgi:hypothetical protein
VEVLISVFLGFLLLGLIWKRRQLRVLSKAGARIIFSYRYVVMFLVVIGVVVLGIYLSEWRLWTGKDTIQVCTGFLILLTLFFAALNYEFTSSKARRDYEAARQLLTFNTACEWHKSPIRDYQRISIGYENAFIESSNSRTVDDFMSFVDKKSSLEFRESLKGLLNYFETSSIAANKGMIDKDFIKEFFLTIYKSYYRDYHFYIEKQRVVKSSDTIWGNFTNLVEEWYPTINEDLKNEKVKSIIIT